MDDDKANTQVTDGISAQIPDVEAQNNSRRPKVIVAHSVFCVLMLCLGLLFLGIGLSLFAARPSIRSWLQSQSYSRGPGSQRAISYHSSEQERAPFYVIAGLAYSAVYAVGLWLPRKRSTYVYRTGLLPLGCWNVIGIPFALLLCIWWFRRKTREFHGFGIETEGRA